MIWIFFFFFFSNLQLGSAVPPAPPVQCDQLAGCVLRSAYREWPDRADCLVGSVVYPMSEAELVSEVAAASRNKQTARAVSGFSHTIPKLSCPADGSNGSVLISTARYNAGIHVDVERRTVTVDAGVGLRDLIDAVEEKGLSLVAAPYWEGASIGGLLSTGSHGSSWWGKGGAVHDHVVAIRLVTPASADEGLATVVQLLPGDPLFPAALVSLGLLGVISKVTLSLEPRFKRSIAYNFTGDDAFQDEFVHHASTHEFADITWYPSQHTAVYKYDGRVPASTSGDGINDFLGFQSQPTFVSTALRFSENELEKRRSVAGKCAVAAAEIGYKKLTRNGLRNEGFFAGYPVVGYQGRMQTSGSCLHSPATDPSRMCPWDPRIKGLFFYETTAIFRASAFRRFVLDVKKLRDLNPANFCGVDGYNGFLIRFIRRSEAYLGQGEDSVVVDFNYYRADDPTSGRLNQDIMEEVEQMAFVEHGARPHWGKNRDVAFLGVQHKYPNWSTFMAAKKQLDPTAMFRSPWLDVVVDADKSSSGDDDDGCALEGRCICSEDRHCNPSNGYLCRPGLVYQQARVCTYSSSSSSPSSKYHMTSTSFDI